MARRRIPTSEQSTQQTVKNSVPPPVFNQDNIPQDWNCKWQGSINNGGNKPHSQLEIKLTFSHVHKENFVGIEINGNGNIFNTRHTITGRLYRDNRVILYLYPPDNKEDYFWLLRGNLSSTLNKCLQISGTWSYRDNSDQKQKFILESSVPPKILYSNGAFSAEEFPTLSTQQPTQTQPTQQPTQTQQFHLSVPIQKQPAFSPAVAKILNLGGPLDSVKLLRPIPIPKEWISPWWGYIIDENNQYWEINMLLTFNLAEQLKFTVWGIGQIKNSEYALKGQLLPNNSFVINVCQLGNEDTIITQMYGVSQPLIPGQRMKISGNFVNIKNNDMFENCVFNIQSHSAPIQHML